MLGYARIKILNEIIKSNWSVENPSFKNFNYNELLFVVQELLDQDGLKYVQGGNDKNTRNKEFRGFVEMLLQRNLANYDSFVLLTSSKGAGKSSAAISIAREWCRLLGIRFNPEKQFAYNNAQVMRAIDTLPPFSPLVCDEGARFASASDWAKKENKALKKKLAEIRTKHLLFVMCFPMAVNKIESTYMDAFVNIWISLYARGKGGIFLPDKNPGMDPWRMKEFNKIGSYNEFTDPGKVEKILKKHPNFWKMIKIPKPPNLVYRRYLWTREQNVYGDADIGASFTTEDISNSLIALTLRDFISHDSTLTPGRVIMHIKNQFNLTITSADLQRLFDNAQRIVTIVRNQKFGDGKYKPYDVINSGGTDEVTKT